MSKVDRSRKKKTTRRNMSLQLRTTGKKGYEDLQPSPKKGLKNNAGALSPSVRKTFIRILLGHLFFVISGLIVLYLLTSGATKKAPEVALQSSTCARKILQYTATDKNSGFSISEIALALPFLTIGSIVSGTLAYLTAFGPIGPFCLPALGDSGVFVIALVFTIIFSGLGAYLGMSIWFITWICYSK